ncbi:hypothetical protein COP05_03815 [Dermabacter jinjuensis]|uniref:Uncharacterized protein n=1 Tax=Dermabacter jinjuensis TaxID=1667168 RepID=A0ABN5DXH6_9MICO|nr:hypothetical protein COP05_03815 [Dermabacter jinjuensis]
MTVVWSALALTVCGCGAVAGNGVIRALLRRIDEGGARVAAAQGTLMGAQKELPGGRWIGILERIAVYVSIVAGFPPGIAVALAVKGLGRYPELRAEKEGREAARVGELFIIGTFASVLWAAAWAGVAVGVRALLAGVA